MRLLFPRWSGAVAVALAALWVPPAHAGLFDDDEARKAILDLRGKMDEQRQQLVATQRQVTELLPLVQQLQQLQRSMLELNNQNEQLRTEIARLRGQDEQFQRDLADLQKRQKDLLQGLEERRKLTEPQSVSIDGRDFMAEPEEKRSYDDAMAGLRNGDFDKASVSLAAFLKRYPSSGYVDSVRYWLGNAQFGKRDYKDAVVTFRAFVAAAPDHLRTPEALLALANCQVELKDNKGARRTLDDLIKQFPKAEAAQAARERLAALK
jgi:tol-pal system protein YbgF